MAKRKRSNSGKKNNKKPKALKKRLLYLQDKPDSFIILVQDVPTIIGRTTPEFKEHLNAYVSRDAAELTLQNDNSVHIKCMNTNPMILNGEQQIVIRHDQVATMNSSDVLYLLYEPKSENKMSYGVALLDEAKITKELKKTLDLPDETLQVMIHHGLRTEEHIRKVTAEDLSEMGFSDDEQKDIMTQLDVYEVECILQKRTLHGAVQYLVKWKNYDVKEATWEPVSHLEQGSLEIIQEYEKSNKSKV